MRLAELHVVNGDGRITGNGGVLLGRSPATLDGLPLHCGIKG